MQHVVIQRNANLQEKRGAISQSPVTPPNHQRALGLNLSQQIAQVQPTIQRRWDRGTTECSEEPDDKWIERVVVNQETPQSVEAHWSDGSVDIDKCSAGKGHCCVDNEDGVACTVAGSRVDGSNCTPITQRNGYLVKHRDLDHNGIAFWTEFVPGRGIALHEYSPVDGTPLSHGCVRLNRSMARKIFCGVRQNQTWVQVQGFARPQCDHPALRSEWEGDFAFGGRDLNDHDGDAATQSSIRETRRMLNAAFGRELSVAEIRSLTADDIPRCTQSVSRPSGASEES